MTAIYSLTNKINNKKYIGKTTDIERRIKEHQKHSRNKVNRVIYDAINKYGFQNFIIDIVENVNDDLSDEREMYWISYYNTTDREYGYNMTDGGVGGNTWHLNSNKEAIGKKLSMSNTGKKRSKEFCERMSRIASNRIMTDAEKEKISVTRKHRIASGEIIIKNDIGEYSRGKYGKDSQLYGFRHSDISKEKISKARTGKNYEEIFDEVTCVKLKSMHKDMWNGEGNPRYINITKEQFVKAMELFSTTRDIASYLNISKAGFYYKFEKIFGVQYPKYRKEHKL